MFFAAYHNPFLSPGHTIFSMNQPNANRADLIVAEFECLMLHHCHESREFHCLVSPLLRFDAMDLYSYSLDSSPRCCMWYLSLARWKNKLQTINVHLACDISRWISVISIVTHMVRTCRMGKPQWKQPTTQQDFNNSEAKPK